MRLAHFRFYEELNDFLPASKRKVSFDYGFNGNPSVKDAIEAIGVPHVEIDMILVNGVPVDFSHKISNGDQISVYPVFESMDISTVSPLRGKPLRETKFLPDIHLGKLSKLLRLCGFDTLYRKDLTTQEIIDVSLSEHRIILTRDKGLLKNRRVTHGSWIRSEKPEEQIQEVLKRFDLKNNLHPFVRCLECNSMLEAVHKEDILDILLPRTREFHYDFKKCRGCGKIYWEGSHFERMKKFVELLMKPTSRQGGTNSVRK